jgi:hypothetical protein
MAAVAGDEVRFILPTVFDMNERALKLEQVGEAFRSRQTKPEY